MAARESDEQTGAVRRSAIPAVKAPGAVRAAVVVGLIVVLAVGVTIVTGLMAGPDVYTSIAREYPGRTVVVLVSILRATHEVFSVLTIGTLAMVLMFTSRTAGLGRSKTSAMARSLLRVFSAIWASAVLVLVVVDGLNTNGLSVAALDGPKTLWFALSGTFYPTAWLIVLIAAFGIFATSLLSETWAAHAVSLWIGMVAILAPIVISQVLVGPDHDIGEDAAIIQTPVAGVVLGLLTAGVLLEMAWPGSGILRRLARSRLLWAGLLVIAGADVAISIFKLAGTPLTATPTGWQLLTRWAGLAVIFLGVLGLRAGRSGWPRAAVLAGFLGWTAMTASMTLIPSPNYFAPNDVVAVFLGYTVDAAPDVTVLLTHWRTNVLLTFVSVVGMIGYAIGVWRLNRRGDVWPLARTLCWMIGWALTIVTMDSGFGKYTPADFGLHMIAHMALSMLIPMFLVLGGPITLLLRSTSGTGHLGQQIQSRVDQLIDWPGMRLLLNPLIVFVVYVASFYLLYLTPLFEGLALYHWGHQLMNVHFLIVGYMFFSVVVGVDRLPYELPHIGRLGFVIAAMPFHAFFGIVLTMMNTPVAQNFYRSLGLDWLDITAEQHFAGGVAWAGGELPLLAVVIILAVVWTRQDERAARRFERHGDSGQGDESAAYDEMLRRLAARGRRPAEKSRVTPGRGSIGADAGGPDHREH